MKYLFLLFQDSHLDKRLVGHQGELSALGQLVAREAEGSAAVELVTVCRIEGFYCFSTGTKLSAMQGLSLLGGITKKRQRGIRVSQGCEGPSGPVSPNIGNQWCRFGGSSVWCLLERYH